MSMIRVRSFSVSLDGFATGEGISYEAPFGPAGQRLHERIFVTRQGRTMFGQDGGGPGVDNLFAAWHDEGIGAEIMGRGQVRPAHRALDQRGDSG